MEEWVSLETLGFPGYEVSNMGRVRNSHTLRRLKTSANQEGIVRVGLMKHEEGRQVTVSVIRLVARMFVPGYSTPFNTPIQLNGDRKDLRASNMKWRPRWFAVKFFRQFELSDLPIYNSKFYDVETGEHYADSREAAMRWGLLEEDIAEAVVNYTPCFPEWRLFAQAQQ